MDSTVDPCENLDSFLCNGFKQRFSSEETANVVLEHRSPMLNKVKGNDRFCKLKSIYQRNFLIDYLYALSYIITKSNWKT